MVIKPVCVVPGVVSWNLLPSVFGRASSSNIARARCMLAAETDVGFPLPDMNMEATGEGVFKAGDLNIVSSDDTGALVGTKLLGREKGGGSEV